MKSRKRDLTHVLLCLVCFKLFSFSVAEIFEYLKYTLTVIIQLLRCTR